MARLLGQGINKEAQKGGPGCISPALTPLIFISKFLLPVVPKSIVIKPSQRSFSFPGGPRHGLSMQKTRTHRQHIMPQSL